MSKHQARKKMDETGKRTIPFKSVAVGQRFQLGGEKHIKLEGILTAALFYGTREPAPGVYGLINNVCLDGPNVGQVSGIGPEVPVSLLDECATAQQGL